MTLVVPFNWLAVLRFAYTALQIVTDGNNQLNRTAKIQLRRSTLTVFVIRKYLQRVLTVTAAGWLESTLMVPHARQSPPSPVHRCRLRTHHSPQL